MTNKGPQVLKVALDRWMEDYYNVFITLHQHRKLPDWVRKTLDWHHCFDNKNHIYIQIHAVDEMQAFVRFQQLWIGLPKE